MEEERSLVVAPAVVDTGTVTPVAVARQSWSSGICDCWMDCKLWCSVLFCFPITLGQLTQRLNPWCSMVLGQTCESREEFREEGVQCGQFTCCGCGYCLLGGYFPAMLRLFKKMVPTASVACVTVVVVMCSYLVFWAFVHARVVEAIRQAFGYTPLHSFEYENDPHSWLKNAALAGTGVFFCLIVPLTCAARQRIRMREGIPPTMCSCPYVDDACCALCCCSCVQAQMMRHEGLVGIYHLLSPNGHQVECAHLKSLAKSIVVGFVLAIASASILYCLVMVIHANLESLSSGQLMPIFILFGVCALAEAGDRIIRRVCPPTVPYEPLAGTQQTRNEALTV